MNYFGKMEIKDTNFKSAISLSYIRVEASSQSQMQGGDP